MIQRLSPFSMLLFIILAACSDLVAPEEETTNFDYFNPDFIMASHPGDVIYVNSETAEVKETFTVNNDVFHFMIWRTQ